MTLYLVATPIGHLGDMTPRAVDALKSVAAVYCEDTRRTRVLMAHFGIAKPLRRYHEHHEGGMQEVMARLRQGEDVALVTDAGLPCISDPGQRLVAAARREGIKITALPGASAAATALVGSGLPADSFIFLGFLPRSPSKQRRALREAAALGRTLVIYESPFRVTRLLEAAVEMLGPEAQASVARELSKVYEEWICGTLQEVLNILSSRGALKGEFVVMIHPEPARTA